MAEKTRGLARASCSTKEHIRHLLHAWRKALSAERIQALCSTAPPGLAKSGQRIDGHRRSSWQIPEEPVFCVGAGFTPARNTGYPAERVGIRLRIGFGGKSKAHPCGWRQGGKIYASIDALCVLHQPCFVEEGGCYAGL